MTNDPIETLIDHIFQLGDDSWELVVHALAARLRARSVAMQAIGDSEGSRLLAAAKLLELATEADEVVSLGTIEEDLSDQ
ncbi:MAG: hypothetical protein RID09_03450 [Coleofasciculus sp. G1-WW12-02]|uniref:hypothetical protein n=1 Tax=unclassified Coleofasciculus TaxID=2692782 RepID=UPI003300FF87